MSESFGKRERAKKKQERAAQKRQRRQERAELPTADAPDADALMARFQRASEALASGSIQRDAYESERRQIFAALGLDDGSAD